LQACGRTMPNEARFAPVDGAPDSLPHAGLDPGGRFGQALLMRLELKRPGFFPAGGGHFTGPAKTQHSLVKACLDGKTPWCCVCRIMLHKVDVFVVTYQQVDYCDFRVALSDRKSPLSLKRLPEIFVSSKVMSSAVSKAAKGGRLRKIGSRLYTRNLTEAAEQIGTFLGTRKARLETAVGQARKRGLPYDPDRLVLFQSLFAELRARAPVTRPSRSMVDSAKTNLAFFESYFSISVRQEHSPGSSARFCPEIHRLHSVGGFRFSQSGFASHQCVHGCERGGR